MIDLGLCAALVIAGGGALYWLAMVLAAICGAVEGLREKRRDRRPDPWGPPAPENDDLYL